MFTVVVLMFFVLLACMLHVDEPSYDRVVDCCKEAIERVPGNIKAHYRCGIAFFHLGRYDDAIASLQKAAELQGKSGAYMKLSPASVLYRCSSITLTTCDYYVVDYFIALLLIGTRRRGKVKGSGNTFWLEPGR